MQHQKNNQPPPSVEGAGKKSGRGHSDYNPRTYTNMGVDDNAAPKYLRPSGRSSGRGKLRTPRQVD